MVHKFAPSIIRPSSYKPRKVNVMCSCNWSHSFVTERLHHSRNPVYSWQSNNSWGPSFYNTPNFYGTKPGKMVIYLQDMISTQLTNLCLCAMNQNYESSSNASTDKECYVPHRPFSSLCHSFKAKFDAFKLANQNCKPLQCKTCTQNLPELYRLITFKHLLSDRWTFYANTTEYTLIMQIQLMLALHNFSFEHISRLNHQVNLNVQYVKPFQQQNL